MLRQPRAYKSVQVSPWRHAIDGSISGTENGKIKLAQGLAMQYSVRSREKKSWQESIFTESQSYSCVCDVIKVHQSHHIKEQFRNVHWVRISQQPWPQDRVNFIWAHVPSACILSGCQSVHMHRCSAGVWRKHRAGRRKTDLIGWFWCVMCSLGYSRICNDTKRTWVWMTDMMWMLALALHLVPG